MKSEAALGCSEFGSLDGMGEQTRIRAVFFHMAGHLTAAGGGGVQICTREYWSALEAAGFQLTPVEAVLDRSYRARVIRRLSYDPYGYVDRDASLAQLNTLANDLKYVFLNLRNLGSLAHWIRTTRGHLRIVMLSHGLESVDYLHKVRTERASISARKLGKLLLSERHNNRLLDHIFCLSPVETEIERWLGARSVSWLPRIVADKPLEWQPKTGRLGFVGTLNHPPNRDGLIAFLLAAERLNLDHLHLRLIGGPEKDARAIADRFKIVEYVGQLDDEALEREAATWACFLHPLFSYARGCSTKLATALQWRLPVATTAAGARGYTWSDGRLELADTPEQLAALANRLVEPLEGQAARNEVERVARSSPDLRSVASQIRNDLGLNNR